MSLQVAAKALETGVFGAYFNVLINLKDMTDDVFKEKVGRCDARLHPGIFHVYCGHG
jgi:formiminotetrahydrofolate cyclodeaminase